MYRSVLLAVDREDEAGLDLLARRGLALAKAMQCEIHLVYVRGELPHSYLHNMPKTWEATQRSEAESWLREFAEESGLADALAAVHSPTGSISREVVALASSIAADCIGVAAHKVDLGRLILGSNATAIARDAPCDVLVVRG